MVLNSFSSKFENCAPRDATGQSSVADRTEAREGDEARERVRSAKRGDGRCAALARNGVEGGLRRLPLAVAQFTNGDASRIGPQGWLEQGAQRLARTASTFELR